MPDLIEFLRARLDEDEAAAKAADLGAHRGAASHGGHWYARVSPYDTLPGQAERWFVEDGFEEAVARRVDAEAGDARGQAQHIARWDPARALAEVAARRAIVDYAQTCEQQWQLHVGEAYSTAEYAATHRTVRYLATVYAEHPDYAKAAGVDVPR